LRGFLPRPFTGMIFPNPGAGSFALKAGEAKTVVLMLRLGREFTAEEVRKSKDATIHIEARATGILVGGVSYQLDPRFKGSAIKRRRA